LPIRRWPNGILVLSPAMLAWLGYVFAARPDFAAAETMAPPAAWLLIGLGVTAAGFRNRRACAAVALLWLLFGAVFVEGFRSSLRPGFRITGPDRAAPDAVRVVSLNCAGGSEAAAREVEQVRPDIVLLQETPVRAAVERLATRLFGREGASWCGLDATIVARSPLRPVQHPRRSSNFVMAAVRVRGVPFGVVSLRLQPPVARMDLWNPECRRSQAESRRSRRKELAEVMGFVWSHSGEGPLLIGGDFNAVAGDPSLAPITIPMRDSFDEAGRGWCDTAINDLPFARIDRLFVERGVEVLASSVRRTANSDHRMLIVDLRARR
jgi:endonuclease/exonuclease/phosphatase family metal-dependent hydrolase